MPNETTGNDDFAKVVVEDDGLGKMATKAVLSMADNDRRMLELYARFTEDVASPRRELDLKDFSLEPPWRKRMRLELVFHAWYQEHGGGRVIAMAELPDDTLIVLDGKVVGQVIAFNLVEGWVERSVPDSTGTTVASGRQHGVVEVLRGEGAGGLYSRHDVTMKPQARMVELTGFALDEGTGMRLKVLEELLTLRLEQTPLFIIDEMIQPYCNEMLRAGPEAIKHSSLLPMVRRVMGLWTMGKKDRLAIAGHYLSVEAQKLLELPVDPA